MRKSESCKSVGNSSGRSLVHTEIIRNKVLWKSRGVISLLSMLVPRPGKYSLGIFSVKIIKSSFVEGCECKHGRSEKEIEKEDENP